VSRLKIVMESVADLADGNKDEQAPAPALPIYKQGAEAVGFAYLNLLSVPPIINK
jgi:hypothetical protein